MRYATYIGSSPYKTPATFAMIAYLELVEGVFMYQVEPLLLLKDLSNVHTNSVSHCIQAVK